MQNTRAEAMENISLQTNLVLLENTVKTFLGGRSQMKGG